MVERELPKLNTRVRFPSPAYTSQRQELTRINGQPESTFLTFIPLLIRARRPASTIV
jgi:hypothetical protein